MTRWNSARGMVLLAASCLTSPRAFAWGPVGHETVAYIAEDHLSSKAQAKVAEVLGPDLSLADVANWADVVRTASRPETANWHFIDIEDRGPVTEGDEPKFCLNHDCVVDQVQIEIATLKDPASTKNRRFEALKFLVHFVGDLHQPLHCANDADRGGNEKFVRFRTSSRAKKGTKIKLHALWDRLIEIKTVEDSRELATALEANLSAAQKAEWAKGTPADWAWESFGIAHDTVYKAFPPGPTATDGVLLPTTYYKTMRPLVDVQLERAGIRLAQVLNEIYGP